MDIMQTASRQHSRLLPEIVDYFPRHRTGHLKRINDKPLYRAKSMIDFALFVPVQFMIDKRKIITDRRKIRCLILKRN